MVEDRPPITEKPMTTEHKVTGDTWLIICPRCGRGRRVPADRWVRCSSCAMDLRSNGST